MAEGDHLRAQSPNHLVDGTAAVAAAQVATVLGLVLDEFQRRSVSKVRPLDSLRSQVLRQRFDRPQELSLLHGEGADREIHRRPVAQQQQRVQKRERILPAGKRDRHTVAVLNHPEPPDRLAHLAQQGFFEVHKPIIAGYDGSVPVSPARAVAFDILRLVEDGGYAQDLLASRAAPLDSRDAGLASEIVLGSLRYQAQLDFLNAHFSGRPADRLDPEVRIALRMAVYQIRYLARVPQHAAVTESVELTKRARKRSAAPLVNAVLRKVHRHAVAWPGRATELSHPEWMLERWDRQYGREAADRIAQANLKTPGTWVRIPGRVPCGIAVESTDVPGAYRLVDGSTEGLCIQDIGAQAVVPLLDLRPGQTFLDVCAAPGNKTAQALESGVRAVACDLHRSRLRHMKDLNCAFVCLDATLSLPFCADFDRILVDAPCSGTGTLARNPEIKWRLRPSDLTDLRMRQTAILRNALERLAPGGRLVYSTCSLEREENEDVVEQSGARVERLWRRIPGAAAGDGFFAAVLSSG